MGPRMERSDAEEQNAGGQALAQIAGGEAGRQALKAPVQIEHRPQKAAQGQAQDEQHRKGAVGHVLHHGVDAKARGGQPHGGVERVAVFFLDALAQQAAQQAPGQNGAGVDDGSDHRGLLICRFLPFYHKQLQKYRWQRGKTRGRIKKNDTHGCAGRGMG